MPRFVDGFVSAAKSIKVGDGLDEGVEHGSTGPSRAAWRRWRRLRPTRFLAARKSRAAASASAIAGYFFAPTVLDRRSPGRARHERGAVRPHRRYERLPRLRSTRSAKPIGLPYGLAAYAYTKSAKTMADVGRDVESGMVSINHHGLALPELPFGGVKDSGYGSEGGAEALEAYLNPKLITQMT